MKMSETEDKLELNENLSNNNNDEECELNPIPSCQNTLIEVEDQISKVKPYVNFSILDKVIQDNEGLFEKFIDELFQLKNNQTSN